MPTQTPFSLRIFVADGDPDGLRLVERSNWIGKAVVFPRAVYSEVRHRSEFQQTGVYLLVGPRTDADGDMLYIGEGDPVGERLYSHFRNKDFWTRAVFFVAGPGQLNKAHVQYLEAQLVARARKAKRLPLENGNSPAEPTLSEADRADMEVFLENMLGMLPVLGISAFEQSPLRESKDAAPLLACHGRNVAASGYDTAQGFVVKAGSTAALNEAPGLPNYGANIHEMRADLIKSGVLVLDGAVYRFSQDFTFNSPSMASGVVFGHNANGRVDWKDSEGRTLKELQEVQADSDNVKTEVEYGDYVIRELESGAIELWKDGIVIVPVKPTLRDLAAELNVNLLNASGNDHNTRQLGSLIMKSVQELNKGAAD